MLALVVTTGPDLTGGTTENTEWSRVNILYLHLVSTGMKYTYFINCRSDHCCYYNINILNPPVHHRLSVTCAAMPREFVGQIVREESQW